MSADRLGYSREEAARVCGVSLDTVRRAIRKGTLRAKRSSTDADGNPSGRYIITRRALEDWLDGLGDA